MGPSNTQVRVPHRGDNTFPVQRILLIPGEVIRATEEEKLRRIQTLEALKAVNKNSADQKLNQLSWPLLKIKNLFEALIEQIGLGSIPPRCEGGWPVQKEYVIDKLMAN